MRRRMESVVREGFNQNQIPAIMRSKLMLEVASELASEEGWPYYQARIQMRPQGGDGWGFTLFGSDSPAGIQAVAEGEADFGIVNPGGVGAMALRGRGPFKEPIPLRAVTVLPQF